MKKHLFIILILIAFKYNISADNNVVIISFAPVPFYEGFENEWINKNSIRDVPSYYWENIPATGFNSWSREDDGINRGAWLYNNGYNLPSGANNTNHSARFHSYEAQKNLEGILDLYVDFSTINEKKYLSFWYINRSGEDSLFVYNFPADSKTIGEPIISLGTSITWTRIIIDLGNIRTQNIIRFLARSDRGYSDIQIDEIIISDLIADFKVNTNFGNAPLKVEFTDNSYYNPTTWLWDFNNDGIIDSKEQNPSYAFNESGFYDVKYKVYKKDKTDSIVKKNFIQVNYYANLPFYENFEGIWIDRDGIRDVPSIYWKNNPPSGNNSWSREDDGLDRAAWDLSKKSFLPLGANNTNHCAKFNSIYTPPGITGELLLYINFSSMLGGKALKFWYINPDGKDSLFIYFSEDGGQNFKKIFNTGISEKWQKYTIDFGNTNTEIGIIKFLAKSDWGLTDIGLDEISIGSLYAKFTCSDTIGYAPLTVYFNNLSYGSPNIVKWDFNNDNVIDSYEYNPIFTFEKEGIYPVKLIIEKDQEKDTIMKTIHVNKLTTLSEKSFNNTIYLYPNPVKDKIYIKKDKNDSNDSIILIEIYNSHGKLIQQIKHFSEIINISDLQNGLYFIRIVTSKNSNLYKIIKT